MRNVLVFALGAVALHCGGSQKDALQPAPGPPTAIIVPPPAPDTPPEAGPPVAPATPSIVPAAAAPIPSEPLSASDPCTGASFELDHLPDRCTSHNAAPTMQAKAFVATLVPDEKTVRSGADVDVVLKLTNVSSADQVVVFTPPCAFFGLEAYAHGKRADYVTDCNFGRGCGGSTKKLVLAPNGVLSRKLKFSPIARKQMSANNCLETSQPLAPGRYELRVSVDGFPLADMVRRVRAHIDVVR